MNSVDMANNLIFRAKHLQEFTITVNVPEDFRFNGLIPFDMSIVDGVISAKVYGIDYEEALSIFQDYIESCK
jgi:hypothetical protein